MSVISQHGMWVTPELLAVDHRVGEVHVGRRLVDEPLALAVDDELRRHHALVEHELQPAVGPAHRREPPRLVEQVGRAADLLPRPDAVTHRGGIAEAPVLLEHRQMLSAPRHVVVESAAGQDDAAPRADALLAAVPFDRPRRVTVPSTSVINSVIGELSHSGMPCSFSASRVLAQSGIADEAAGDLLQVFEHPFGVRYVALFALAWRWAPGIIDAMRRPSVTSAVGSSLVHTTNVGAVIAPYSATARSSRTPTASPCRCGGSRRLRRHASTSSPTARTW